MELLTGKCKEDFEKFYNDSVAEQDEMYNWYLDKFYESRLSFKWGVYQDFFDQRYIRIEIKCKKEDRFNYGIWDDKEWIISSEFFKTRPEARKEAILTANRIYNERTN